MRARSMSLVLLLLVASCEGYVSEKKHAHTLSDGGAIVWLWEEEIAQFTFGICSQAKCKDWEDSGIELKALLSRLMENESLLAVTMEL